MRIRVRWAAVVAVAAGVAAVLVGVTPAQATATSPGTFVPLTPARLLDTRSGVGAAAVPVAPLGTVRLQVTGRGNVPSTGVAAVLLNVTVTNPTGTGYVTAYPDGQDRPKASNLNFVARQTVPNLVAARLGANGRVALYNGSGGTVDLLADVAGYYLAGTPVAGGAFAGLSPTRLLDTRAGTGAPRAALAPGATLRLQTTGGVVPAGASAVLLNVTVTNPTGTGYLTAYPDGQARPTASNLNFAARQTVPNLVAVRVGAGGGVDVYNGSGGTVDVLADVAGYFLGGGAVADGAFASLPPARVLDTRTGIGTAAGAVAPTGTVHLQVTGRGGVPATGVAAVLLNVTVVKPTGAGYVTVYPDATTRPTASNLNFGVGATVANLVSAPVGAGGRVALYNGSGGSTAMLADVAGYVLVTPDTTPPAPVSALHVTAVTTNSVALAWTNPSTADFTGVVVRRAVGSTPPASPSAGTSVADTAASAFTDTGLTAGTTYSYAVFAHDAVPNYAAAATVGATTAAADTTPPGPVTDVHVLGTTTTTVSLGWTNPSAADFDGVLIRRATGSTPPVNPTAGTAVYNFPGDTDTDGGLTAGTTYSYALFAHDAVPNYAPAATITVTTAVGPTGAVMRLGAVDWIKASTYWANPNWADPDVVRLYTDSAGRLGVATYHPAGSTITVQSFDPATRQQVGTTRTVTLPAAYPDWGGLYAAPTGDFYVAVGQDNHAQNDALNVVAIQRYNASWQLVGTAYVKGNASQGTTGVYEPFAFGTAHMQLVGGKLVVHMARLMYGVDGVNHQGNLTVEVDVASMTATPFSQLGQYVYSSHSFQQLVTTWNGSLVLLDQGDSYPRAVQMGVYANYPAGHAVTTLTDLLEFDGAVGDNFTGATLTGVVSGPSGIVAVGNSIAQPDAPNGPQGGADDNRNAYLVAANPTTGVHTLTWLTAFSATGSQDAQQPRVVQVGADRFAVLFGVTDGATTRTEYRLINSAGAVLASATFAGLTFAAGTDPALLGGRVYWAGQVSGAGYVYGLDVSDPTHPQLITG